jgi:hypothetical protein
MRQGKSAQSFFVQGAQESLLSSIGIVHASPQILREGDGKMPLGDLQDLLLLEKRVVHVGKVGP